MAVKVTFNTAVRYSQESHTHVCKNAVRWRDTTDGYTYGLYDVNDKLIAQLKKVNVIMLELVEG